MSIVSRRANRLTYDTRRTLPARLRPHETVVILAHAPGHRAPRSVGVHECDQNRGAICLVGADCDEPHGRADVTDVLPGRVRHHLPPTARWPPDGRAVARRRLTVLDVDLVQRVVQAVVVPAGVLEHETGAARSRPPRRARFLHWSRRFSCVAVRAIERGFVDAPKLLGPLARRHRPWFASPTGLGRGDVLREQGFG